MATMQSGQPAAPAFRALHVRDVMSREPVCVDPATTMRDLARLFEEHEISGAPVVGSGGEVIGMVSKTDLVRRCLEARGEGPPGMLFEMLSEEAGEETGVEGVEEPRVEEFMTEDPVTCSPDDSLAKVARRMAEDRIHRMIVVDGDRIPVGMITTLDVLKVFPEIAPATP